MKTLVIIAHPNLEGSRVNQRWTQELLRYPNDIAVHELYKAYPDWNIDVPREQHLLEAVDFALRCQRKTCGRRGAALFRRVRCLVSGQR